MNSLKHLAPGILFCITILCVTYQETPQQLTYKPRAPKRYNGPEEFFKFHQGIRTPDGATAPAYRNGQVMEELAKAKSAMVAARTARTMSNGVIEFTERGPANVPGRMRGLIVDPDDPAKNTWYAGSAGGGVWKTTNAGQLWTLITPDLANLATTVLAMAESNHDVIYTGTGEGFGNVDGIRGNGIYKSTDRGASWSLLSSTTGFNDINRIIVDPANEDIVIAASNLGIYRTTDGGASWTKVYNGFVQDLKYKPGDFTIQYATQNGVGLVKSIDGGVNWELRGVGLVADRRIEIAVSPSMPSRIAASVEGSLSGTNSDVFISDDDGETWSLVDVSLNGTPINYLGNQGWYDNTLAFDPYNENIVYLGGIGLFRVVLQSGSSQIPQHILQQQNTFFLELVQVTNFSNTTFDVTALGTKSVEIRFGPGVSQKAHRFMVPVGATSGVPDINYTYHEYIDVPFEVWDVTNNVQLMASFRDQDRNNVFNLLPRNTDGAPEQQSREYIYIHDIPYSETASPNVSTNGGQVNQMMYNIWPVLSAGQTWDPDNLPTSTLSINFSSLEKQNATSITVADVYGEFDSKNAFNTFGTDMHPDQHNIVMIPVNEQTKTYKILVANDGGVFLSNTSTAPGINQGNWTMVGRTLNTTQFYGADKRPGRDEYFGGTQDNGTWVSPAAGSANSTTNYRFSIGGDGFEVLWHTLEPNKLIGGSQGNNFRRSTDGGFTWTNATSGLSGSHPFISKLAHSKNNPDVIYTVSTAGVFKSINFGETWSLRPISTNWVISTTFLDVEVSAANSNIVWAGSGMNNFANLYVSTDEGNTFSITENYTGESLGRITKLATHPYEENTAYALFSFAGKPKILRTTDLGQTWQDISGFEGNDVSDRGFPDVAVYCLYVRQDNPDILWAGTEIGIVESLDNGLTWAMLPGFPNVSVWDMKGQDNQVVIATHGRGIWTATLAEQQRNVALPSIVLFGSAPKKTLKLKLNAEEPFDSIRIFSGTTLAATIRDVAVGEAITEVITSSGTKNIKMIAYRGSAPFHSATQQFNHLNILNTEDTYLSFFFSIADVESRNLVRQSLPGITSSRAIVQTIHPYAANREHILQLRTPVRIADGTSILEYEDIALIEPGEEGAAFGTPEFKDYVVVEGTLDGLHWAPLADAYDARKNQAWLDAYNANTPGNNAMFVKHTIDLKEHYAAGDSVLIRFRMVSDGSVSGWGWALNYVAIQEAPLSAPLEEVASKALTIYPNPTTGKVSVSFEVVTPTQVSIKVVDLLGRTAVEKSLGQKDAGKHEEDMIVGQPAGTYIVLLQTGAQQQSTRLIIR